MKKLNVILQKRVIIIFFGILFISQILFPLYLFADDSNNQKFFEVGKEFLKYVINGNYEKAINLMDKKMQQAFNKDSFLQTKNYINKKYGKIINIKLQTISLYNDIHLVYITVEHKMAKVLYMIAIDNNFKVAGFYIKKEEFNKQ